MKARLCQSFLQNPPFLNAMWYPQLDQNPRNRKETLVAKLINLNEVHSLVSSVVHSVNFLVLKNALGSHKVFTLGKVRERVYRTSILSWQFF